MTKELSGLTVVIIVAGGILTLILLFIFVKRQIVRFALRSRRGPHVPVGHDAKKVLIWIYVIFSIITYYFFTFFY